MSFPVVLAIAVFAACWIIPAICLAASASRRGLPAMTFLGIGIALGPILSVALLTKPIPAVEADRTVEPEAPRRQAPLVTSAEAPYASTVSGQILGRKGAGAIGTLVADSDITAPSPRTPRRP